MLRRKPFRDNLVPLRSADFFPRMRASAERGRPSDGTGCPGALKRNAVPFFPTYKGKHEWMELSTSKK
jgi:hypothetical protein